MAGAGWWQELRASTFEVTVPQIPLGGTVLMYQGLTWWVTHLPSSEVVGAPFSPGATLEPFGVQHSGKPPRPPLFSHCGTTPQAHRVLAELGGRSQPSEPE